LCSSDPVVFSLLTKFVYLEVVVLETGTETFYYIFQQTHITNTPALKTYSYAVQQCTRVKAHCYITA